MALYRTDPGHPFENPGHINSARARLGTVRHDRTPIDWPIRTARLHLRPFVPADDTAALWVYRRRPEVQYWLGGRHQDLDAFTEARKDVLEPPWVVLVAELDGTIIGDLFAKVEDGWAQKDVADLARNTQAELGWVFDPNVHGKGYATEAVAALVDLCSGPLQLRRVHADCFAGNEASWRLMERLGMRREQHGRADSLHRDLGWVDGMLYGLLAEEWNGPTASGG